MSFILFLILSTQVIHSQNVININKCDSKNTYRQKVLKILDSQEISNINNPNNLITEINYSELNNISIQNTDKTRYLIVRITDDITSLNLNQLNQFLSLQIIHFIVEKSINENILEDIFNSSNNNWVITYQIEVPQ